MRFLNIVVAALSAPLCVDSTPQERDEAVEESMPGNHLTMTSVPNQPLTSVPSSLVDEGSLAPSGLDASTGKASLAQGIELRNPEYEIEHASGDEIDDDFNVDIGRLAEDCTSHPVVNETGEMTSADFRDLVSSCYSDSPYLEDCPNRYNVGLHCWDTSFMTDLSSAFYGLYYFNDDISSWETGKVTTLSRTFHYAPYFNSDISSWDTSNVATLSQTFYQAYRFNSDISSWDTGKVTDMESTFDNALSFDSDISSWDIHNVRTLKLTFYVADAFNSDVSSWNTGKVTTLEGTFLGAWEFNSDVSSWDTGKVTSMDRTFYDARSFNSDVSAWDTGKVTTLRQTFERAYKFNSDISSWNTGNVKNLRQTFARARSFNQDIASWDTGKVTTLHRTFARAGSFNQDISSWDTGKVKTMKRTFQNAVAFNQCLGSWAANSPDTVSTYSMLKNTACPNQSDPDPEKGPWCQGFEDRCFGACVDAEEFRFGENQKSCGAIHEWKKENIEKRCKKLAFPGEEGTGQNIRVQDVCQEACGKHGFGPGKTCFNFSDSV